MTTEIKRIYTRRARFYDISEKIYALFGFREEKYRRIAINKLNLQEGDLVVDLGCGTGKNFSQIQEIIGPTGKIIGVDLTLPMLQQAQRKVTKFGWKNVSLVEADMSEYLFPENVDAVLSTFALSFCEKYDTVIKQVQSHLRDDGRIVVADMQWNQTLPKWFMRLFILSARPFGVSEDTLKRNLFFSFKNHFRSSTADRYYFGCVCVIKGTKLSSLDI